MNKLGVVIFALAFVTMSAVSQASNTTAQTRCNLTEATAPSVRGLRLGMTAQQLLALFPGATKKREMKDVIEQAKSVTGTEATYLAFDPAADGAAQQFAGVDTVSAGLYKARVVEFSVQYVGATWETVDDWIAKLSETFKLASAQDWVAGSNETPTKILKCEGVLIEASIQGGGATIKIRSNAYVRENEERAKAAEEKKRQETRP